MSNYTFMSISKIKSYGTLVSKWKHNRRVANVENADASLAMYNESLVPIAQRDGKEMDYRESFHDRLSTLDYYKTHKVRQNGVLGYEILMTFPRDGDPYNLEEWKQKSLIWLHDTFDVAPDNRSNVINVEYHADESGSPHIHAFVIPIDERGRLNARRFTGGAALLSELQTTYADYVKSAGLKRGVAGSSASHKAIRRMYADLNAATTIPELESSEETGEHYRARVISLYESMAAVKHREINEEAAAARRNVDQYASEQRQMLSDDLERQKNEIRTEREQAQKETDRLKQQSAKEEEHLSAMQEQMQILAQQMYEMQREIAQKKKDEEELELFRRLQVGLDVIEYNDPEEAAQLRENISYAVDQAEEWDDHMAEVLQGRRRDVSR